MNKELDEDDYNMINYFYFHKGDITRWASWEDKKPLFEKYHPELIDAIKRVESAEKTLKVIIKNLSNNYGDD